MITARRGEDLVQQFERRLDAMDGNAMIVCMSRRICVDLYNELIKLRPLSGRLGIRKK